MTERTTLLQEVGAAFRDNGLTAAITALIGGFIALLAAVTRRAFTNDAMLVRMDRELLAERDRVDRQRAEDRKGDADRLEGELAAFETGHGRTLAAAELAGSRAALMLHVL